MMALGFRVPKPFVKPFPTPFRAALGEGRFIARSKRDFA